MSGTEHYAEAERLLALAESCDWTKAEEPYRDPALIAAQVHATLALTAATISAAAHPNQSVVDYLGEWFEVTA